MEKWKKWSTLVWSTCQTIRGTPVYMLPWRGELSSLESKLSALRRAFSSGAWLRRVPGALSKSWWGLTSKKHTQADRVHQVERGAKLSIKNNEQKTPLDLMFVCIQSPGDFISSLWSKRVRSNLDFDWSLILLVLKVPEDTWPTIYSSNPTHPNPNTYNFINLTTVVNSSQMIVF